MSLGEHKAVVGNICFPGGMLGFLQSSIHTGSPILGQMLSGRVVEGIQLSYSQMVPGGEPYVETDAATVSTVLGTFGIIARGIIKYTTWVPCLLQEFSHVLLAISFFSWKQLFWLTQF